jgi:hypothetical protein
MNFFFFNGTEESSGGGLLRVFSLFSVFLENEEIGFTSSS